jgi:hypothetical protein
MRLMGLVRQRSRDASRLARRENICETSEGMGYTAITRQLETRQGKGKGRTSLGRRGSFHSLVFGDKVLSGAG